jgi:hypothetical protein
LPRFVQAKHRPFRKPCRLPEPDEAAL